MSFTASNNFPKVINCPIHGHITLTPSEVAIIDTPAFQRLRELKQLGVTSYVYPGATHNRFEHSIGVCHLAGVWIEYLSFLMPRSLRKNQLELGIDDSDVKCVRIAGLAHDMGHGPFSHLFDGLFIPSVNGDSEWKHEDASLMMLDKIWIENRSDIDVTPSELAFIKDLILGEPRSIYRRATQKPYLFDLISNKRTSIDVDKFDYILRDCHNVGLRTPLDPGRLITFSRVIEDQICFNQKEAFNLYELFRSRYTLFKQVYTHKVSTAIEYMIRDILVAAEPILNLADDIHDMDRYMFLNDSIVNWIERSSDDELRESRAILRRLRSRDLYRFVDMTIIPPDLWAIVDSTCISAELIADYCEGIVQVEDIIVQWLNLGYAMKEANPIDSVGFYTKYEPNKKISIKKEMVSGFIPAAFKEVNVRVYSRRKENVSMVQAAFRKLLSVINIDIDSDLLAESSECIMEPIQAVENEVLGFPIMDSVQNPFLNSPIIPSAKRRVSDLFTISPGSKRVLEVSDGLSLPSSLSSKKGRR